MHLDELEEGALYGDGNQWSRGPVIGKSGYAVVFVATLNKYKRRRTIANRLRPVMAVKSSGTTSGDGGEPAYNLLLEYPSGGTLEDLIARSGGIGLPENDVWRYTKSLLLGLVHLHDHGYVHRNLKPNNVVLLRYSSTEFIAKIGNYESVVKIEKLKKTLWRPYSRTGVDYLSPEAFSGGNQGHAADVWAVGCIVYEMLTGKSVWEGREEVEIRAELRNMKKGRGRINFNPNGVSENGKEFLKGCFETEAKSRWTAERLLRLPFLASTSS
ncbi:mitogen-activated protein kinase kinase kinase 4-like [Sesamum indicum]|uniref:Mitogen-activated protein kinase kinase kinase 4-like n=1 Tax=Sesamum indicum TaxID=4182 RepID=A0A8M8UWA0_SESIN|nr:mitogen-activated protein kinase kinase kinase 4-like [Sesamum indicum]